MATRPTTERPAAADPDEPHSRRYFVFGIVSMATLMISLDQTIVATALAAIQKDLHTTVNWSTWTMTVYALGQIVILPIAGRLSDQFGRRRVFLIAITVFAASSLACGFAQDIYTLIALRAIQSLGGGALMPSATGIVADYFGRDRDRMIGLFTGVFALGGIAGPILGGVFVSALSWRWIFFVNVPIGLVLLALTWAVVADVGTRHPHRLDVPGVFLLGSGLLAGMLGTSMLGSNIDRMHVMAAALSFVVATTLLATFYRRSGLVSFPVIPRRLLVGPGFAVLNTMNFFWGVGMLGFGALVPLYAEQRFDIPVLGAGTLLTGRAIGMAVVTTVAALALRRTGYRRPIALGLSITAVGLFLLDVPHDGMSNYAWLAGASCVVGVGAGISIPASNVAILDLAPDDMASVAGLRAMFRQCGGIAGISIVSTVVARSANHGVALGHSFVILGLILLLLLAFVRRIPERPKSGRARASAALVDTGDGLER